MATSDCSPVKTALKKQILSASVNDLDHRRISGGVAVETDYIISVEPTCCKEASNSFQKYSISKTFHSFRSLAKELQTLSEKITLTKKSSDQLSPGAKDVVLLSESINRLVESQRTQYLGKVNFYHVKSLAKSRSQLINDILDTMIKYYPSKVSTDIDNEPLLLVASAIETFFLTDFCDEDDDVTDELRGSCYITGSNEELSGSSNMRKSRGVGFSLPKGLPKSLPKAPKVNFLSTKNRKNDNNNSGNETTTRVVPLTVKQRNKTETSCMCDDDMLEMTDGNDDTTLEAEAEADATATNKKGGVFGGAGAGNSTASTIGDMIDNNQFIFFLVCTGAILILKRVSNMSITVDIDIAMLIAVACFSLGLHIPRSSSTQPVSGGIRRSSKKKRAVSFETKQQKRTTMLMKRAMSARDLALIEEEEEYGDDEEDVAMNESPLPKFPEGAELGSILNCWSIPDNENFSVRGPKYLSDKKKIKSGPYVFPARGMDLFLTDLCPENVGRNSGVMGGNLRDVPTFLINFRLPWGVFLIYYEIPEKFLPFLMKRYEPTFDDSTLPSLDEFSPSDRTVAKFLMGDDKYKNDRLKIVPVIVRGPWVVKSVVGGKPALIGTKMPINWVYEPADPSMKKACYLEADLDIVSSSTARGILSVCRSATQELTIDLGFVVQGNTKDELPEQMLTGSRVHGLDPLNSPALPPMQSDLPSPEQEPVDD